MSQFDPDREAVLERARAAGVETIVAIGSGTGPGSLDCGVQLAEQHDWIHATVGIHPHEARLASEAAYEELENVAQHPKVIAIGEIGLDYFYEHSRPDVQRRVFTRQIELAHRHHLPIIIHCRPSGGSDDAWRDCFDILRANRPNRPVVFHCFTGTTRQAEVVLSDIGNSLISLSGMVTFPKLTQLHEVAREIPLRRMLIETDSPFLAPVPYRGKRNEPAYVAQVAAKIAELRGLSAEEVGEATYHNFHSFFKLRNIHKEVPQPGRGLH
jgi:TatD DNase family protein